MEYNAPYGVPDTNAPYINGDPSVGRAGSIPPATSIEYPQREIVNAILFGGLTPTNSDLTQLAQVIGRAGRNFVIDTGVANSMVVSPSPQISTYVPGLTYEVLVAASNTSATTINVSALGTRPVVHIDGSALKAGDIVSGGIALIAYDGLKFQLLATSSSAISEASLLHYGVDTGATNALVATVNPGITAYVPGLTALVLLAHGNTGACTVNLNGLGAKALVRSTGAALSSGDLTASCLALMSYDGTSFELINVQISGGGGGGGGGSPYAFGDEPYWIAVISATVSTPPVSPTTGDTYLVPTNGSGGWASVHNQLAQWNGTAWVYADYPRQSMVGPADTDDFLKRTGTGWRSIFATLTEAKAGTSTSLALTPADLAGTLDVTGPFRPYWLAVISASVTAPPGSPTNGDAYIVPSGASGAWSGQTNKIAQWNGPQAAWVFRDYPLESYAGVADISDIWKRTNSGWRTAYATIAEARAGISVNTIINPADLSAVLGVNTFDEANSFFLGMM